MRRSFYALLAAIAIASASVSQAQQTPAAPPAGNPGPAGARGPGALGGGAGRGGGRGGFGGQQFPVGPQADVPPEVAIPGRPTAALIDQWNDQLKKLIAADTSPMKSDLEKYAKIVAPINVAATYTNTAVRSSRHDAFVERAKKGDIDLLFEGDSITDWWQQDPPNGGSAMMKKYFGDVKAANFAVAGDTTQGVLWGLKNGEGQGFQPKAIMLMIGTNNLSGTTTPAEIAEGVGAIVQENRKDFPNAKILLLAVFPRGVATDANRPKIADINKIISKLDDHQHVFYMDIGPKFLDDKGVFMADTFRGDNLHPTEKGYDIWGAAVKDTLADMLK